MNDVKTSTPSYCFQSSESLVWFLTCSCTVCHAATIQIFIALPHIMCITHNTCFLYPYAQTILLCCWLAVQFLLTMQSLWGHQSSSLIAQSLRPHWDPFINQRESSSSSLPDMPSPYWSPLQETHMYTHLIIRRCSDHRGMRMNHGEQLGMKCKMESSNKGAK